MPSSIHVNSTQFCLTKLNYPNLRSLFPIPLSHTPIPNKTTIKERQWLNGTVPYLGLHLWLDFFTPPPPPPPKKKRSEFGL